MPFGDYTSPDTMDMLEMLRGRTLPDPGGPADDAAPYNLSTPSAMGGGASSLGALSNMLMALGSTSMMLDPQSRNAGVALIPHIQRQIASQQAAQEYTTMTDLVGKAEEQAGGDPRKMLSYLQDSGFKARTPETQKAMLTLTSGLRDKVMAAQRQVGDRGAVGGIMGSYGPQEGQPVGEPEPANYVEQTPAFVQKIENGRLLDKNTLLAKALEANARGDLSTEGLKSFVDTIGKFEANRLEHNAATGQTFVTTPGGVRVKTYQDKLPIGGTGGIPKGLMDPTGATPPYYAPGQLVESQAPGKSVQMTTTGPGGRQDVETMWGTPKDYDFPAETKVGFALNLTDPRTVERWSNSTDPTEKAAAAALIRDGQLSGIASRLMTDSDRTIAAGFPGGVIEWLRGQQPDLLARVLKIQQENDVTQAGKKAGEVKTAEGAALLGPAPGQPGQTMGSALAAQTEGARKTVDEQMAANKPFSQPGIEVWSRSKRIPVAISNAQANDMANFGKDGDFVKIPVKEGEGLRLAMTMTPQLDRAEELAKRLLTNDKVMAMMRSGRYTLEQMAQNNPDLKEWHDNSVYIATEAGRILSGSSRVPVTLLAMLKSAMPASRATLDVALRDYGLLRGDMSNRFNAVLGNPMEGLNQAPEFNNPMPTVSTPRGRFNIPVPRR